MIPETKWIQYGTPNANIKGIVIHNTNNQGKSAAELEEWMATSKTSAGAHFFVDYKEVRQAMPLDWNVFNVGNGLAFGNRDCIAIEICSHPSNKLYLQGEARALDLIRGLMKQFSLTKEDIYFHRDFQPNINCPAQIIKRYGTKANFLNLIEEVSNDKMDNADVDLLDARRDNV